MRFALTLIFLVGYSLYGQTYLGETDILTETGEGIYRRAYPYIAPATGTLDSVCVHYNCTGLSTRVFYMGIYDDAMGVPGTRLGYTSVLSTTATSRWHCAKLIEDTPEIAENDTIWLSCVFSAAAFVAVEALNGDLNVNRRQPNTDYTYTSGMPATFGLSSSTQGQLSMYAHFVEEEAPPAYNPVAGRHVRFYKDGVEQKPKEDNLYWIKNYPPAPPPSTDTIQYFFAEDFESWTNATVQNKDSLYNRLPISLFNYYVGQHEIFYAGGEYGNVWQTTIPTGTKQGFQYFIHLGDTAREVWYDFDIYVDPTFEFYASDGFHYGGKLPGGFYMSNSFNTAETDTSTDAGRGGWVHRVFGTANEFIYAYHQPTPRLPLADMGAYADSGAWSTPLGYYQHNTVRMNVGDIGGGPGGLGNGFCEVFINGVFVVRVSGFKFRSVAQGDDFGKIEAIYNAFAYGGEGESEHYRNNAHYIRIDNLVAYKYKPAAANYSTTISASARIVPRISPPQSELVPSPLLYDETYTNASDTIFDVGNGRHYIYNPPNSTTVITKVISRPSGTINYTFLREEFGYAQGYGGGTGSYHVLVYSGTGIGKTHLKTFGRTEDGYENPSGTYTIPTNTATIEMIVGYQNYVTRGVAIRYWQP